MGIKNRLIGLQDRLNKGEKRERGNLLKRREIIEI
jgi:hypothetical protein